jgi:DNA-binding transcriptional LysR family regulator
LERQIGTQLLDRRGRTLRLTPAGRALVNCADAILRRLVDAEAELEAITGARQRPLRLATSGDSAATWLPSVIRRFRERHPEIQVALSVVDARAGVGFIDSGAIDIAVVEVGTGASIPAGIAHVPLFEDPLRLLVPCDHLVASHGPIRLSELADEWWIVPPPPARAAEIFADLCAREDLRPRSVSRVDDVLAVHGMVASGLGVGVLPATGASLRIRDDVIALAIAGAEPTRRIIALVRNGIERSPAVAGMLSDLRAARPRIGCPPGNAIAPVAAVRAG